MYMYLQLARKLTKDWLRQMMLRVRLMLGRGTTRHYWQRTTLENFHFSFATEHKLSVAHVNTNIFPFYAFTHV